VIGTQPVLAILEENNHNPKHMLCNNLTHPMQDRKIWFSVLKNKHPILIAPNMQRKRLFSSRIANTGCVPIIFGL
jgi:hypothetical protein